MSFSDWKGKKPATAPTVTGLEVNANQPKGNVTMNSSVASNALTGKITIANTEMAIIEYKGQRVLTLAMIDQVHNRPEGTARKRFSDHRERFVLDEDYFKVSASEIRTHKICAISDKVTEDITLITESGYLMLVKSFTDDLAWQVQRQLVKGYFKAKEQLTVIDPMKALSDPNMLRGLLLSYSEELITVKAENESMKVDVKALEQISKADGSLCITDAAKALQVNPKFLFSWLRENRWIYKRVGNNHDVGYQDKVQSGYLEHKVTEVTRGDGSTKITEQVRVTPKGLAKLAKLLAKGEAA